MEGLVGFLSVRKEKQARYTIARRAHLKRKYDISLEEYEDMFRKQDGKCRICNDPYDSLHVDHDHATGDVRGLLCNNCNAGLGMFKDSPELMVKAIKYLKEAGLFKELYSLLYK